MGLSKSADLWANSFILSPSEHARHALNRPGRQEADRLADGNIQYDHFLAVEIDLVDRRAILGQR
jgi:hypothetical protein